MRQRDLQSCNIHGGNIHGGAKESEKGTPDAEGGDADEEDDLGGKDGEVLPRAVGIPGLQLLEYQEHRPQSHHRQHLHTPHRSLLKIISRSPLLVSISVIFRT